MANTETVVTYQRKQIERTNSLGNHKWSDIRKRAKIFAVADEVQGFLSGDCNGRARPDNTLVHTYSFNAGHTCCDVITAHGGVGSVALKKAEFLTILFRRTGEILKKSHFERNLIPVTSPRQTNWLIQAVWYSDLGWELESRCFGECKHQEGGGRLILKP